VLLPVFALLRRADVVTVIGAALVAKAAGAGVRTVAEAVGRPVETVRGWLRRFAGRAEAVRVVFTALLVDAGVDPVPPAAAVSAFADAVAAVAGASAAVASRWPEVGEVPPWLLAAAVSGGRLLAPGWP
jgi:transcriptional regulator GlxA family with amidase domain